MDNKLIEAKTIIPSLVEEMRYATKNNILNKKIYKKEEEACCRLMPIVAKKLKKAAELLAKRKSGYRLKVWDCYRPDYAQVELWNFKPDPRYIAIPKGVKYGDKIGQGSYHNSGRAVDLTIIDDQGQELTMPTEFDSFSRQAWQSTEIAEPAASNRLLLREIMQEAGFDILETEWWHYHIL